MSLVPQLISQTETELFRVVADEPSYWRLLSLNNFDGVDWNDSSSQSTSVPDSGTVPLNLSPPTPGRMVDQQYTITGLGGSEMPVAGLPLTVDVPEFAQGHVFADPNTGDIGLDDDLEESFRYNVQATVPDATFEDLKRAKIGGVGIRSSYLTVPDLSPAVQRLAREWTKGAKTHIEKLAAIQGRLRGFDYSLDIAAPTSQDYLEEFLLETRIGYCQQFATAFALLARHLGYPTRVAVGFLPGETDPANPDTYVVSGNETHAWPEVLFQGYGWVAFEPTPRQESSEPIYTLEEVASAPATISGAEATAAAPGQRGRDAVQGNPNAQTRNEQRLDRSGRTRGAGPVQSRWQENFAQIALVLGLLTLLFITLVPLLKKMQTDRRYRRATDTRSTAAAAFHDFQQEASELASERGTAESAAAYARRIAQEASLPKSAAVRLAWIYEASEFAPEAVPAVQADEAKRLARQLKARLWSQAGWWRRAKRLWSPARLIPAPRARHPVPLRRVALLGRS